MSFGGMIAASGAFTRPAEPVRRKLAVLGDSYTGGSGLAPDGALRFETWANFVAKLLGADSFINFGIGGTGWITDGSGTTKFSGRTADILAYNPDILLILGSRNDSYDNAALTTAVTNLLNSFASIKQVYVSGPSTSPFSNRNTSIKAATVAVGRPFLDGIAGAWITEADLGPDGVHPTFNGHKKIARAYYEAILANPDVSGGTVPPGPTVIFSDDFERPDGNLYGSTTPTGGYTWAAAGTDTATISGGAVAMTATTEQFAFVMAGTNTNGRLSATMTAGARGELLMRYQNVSNYLWLDGNTASPYKYRLRQRIANVTTDIATLEAVPAPGDQIVVDLNGTTATVTINGTQLFNGTVPTISGGYGYGFIAYPSTVSQRWGSISLTALP
ncbi:SGNH/GDSL hydrolase family protein [Paenarthrobacter nicotinovorans]|uniref:SGNH/GDSL hydrolase family protein n=1 Tax=Paenarthrobacter nicotinovorans TaxID=29320 RepID=UPI00381C03B9